MNATTGTETESLTNQQEGVTVARADRRTTFQQPTRCATCTGTLFVKLTRDGETLRRESYCPECAARDVTSAAGRRAAIVAAATRELQLGAA